MVIFEEQKKQILLKSGDYLQDILQKINAVSSDIE